MCQTQNILSRWWSGWAYSSEKSHDHVLGHPRMYLELTFYKLPVRSFSTKVKLWHKNRIAHEYRQLRLPWWIAPILALFNIQVAHATVLLAGMDGLLNVCSLMHQRFLRLKPPLFLCIFVCHQTTGNTRMDGPPCNCVFVPASVAWSRPGDSRTRL